MKKKPAFFCEFCGTQVRQNDRVCSHCGKFFSSVKCPSCGFSGDAKIFRDGCPACGYAFTEGSASTGSRALKGGGVNKRWGSKHETDPLPWWIYVASLAFLALLVAVILLRR